MDNKTTPDNPLKSYFERVYNRPVSDTEVAEYKDRLVKFFNLLIEIDQRERRRNDEAKTN